MPAIVGNYPGDALWALLVLLLIALVRPNLTTRQLAMGALAICYTVELFQLYQSPWINSIRENPVGHLILGSAFDWLDLIAYTAGVGLGWVMDHLLLTRRGAANNSSV